MSRPVALISGFAVALVLSLLSFMTVAAVLTDLIAEWTLSNQRAGWFGGIFFAGYILAVLVLTSLTDRIDARQIYLVSGIVGGIASVLLGLFADGFWSGLVLRFFAGVGLGGMYMPGLRALTDRLPEKARNRGVVYYTSFFALGSGLSVFVAGELNALFGWRWAFIISGAGYFAAAAIIALLIRRQPLPERDKNAGHPLDFRPVLRNRQSMGYVIAFIGTAWEVFAFRVWAVAFVGFLQLRDAGDYWISPPAMAFIIALVGIPSSMILGEMAAKVDRRRILLVVSGLSALFAVGVGWVVGGNLDYEIIIAVALALGATSYGRNAATTGGMLESAPPELRGLTMAFHSFIGFSGGILGPLAIGIALDMSGGIEDAAAWGWAFTAVAIGPVATFLGLAMLARSPTKSPARNA